jgi:hypothetical protein
MHRDINVVVLHKQVAHAINRNRIRSEDAIADDVVRVLHPVGLFSYAARAAAIAGPVIRHPQIARQIEGDPTRVLILQVMSRR